MPSSDLARATPVTPGDPIVFSIVVLTFSRDTVLQGTLDALAAALGTERRDYEVVLVDNNVDAVDRSAWLHRFASHQYLKSGVNRGVVARNDGMDAAHGEILVVLDDDVLVQTRDFLDRLAEGFERDPRIGAVTVRKIDHSTGTTRADAIPHTLKTVDMSKSFETFRFIGGCVAFRAETHRQLKGFSKEIFWGLEEIEYSYRMIESGWRMLYLPDVAVVELEHPAGRRPMQEVETEVLTNKLIVSYLHMPFPHVLLNAIGFPIYTRLRGGRGGRAQVLKSAHAFLTWLQKPDRARRRPIGPAARAYIKACGGHLWR